ncbi:MAG: hypothetical protein ABJN26_22575 [Stappiaceae bacterium]
MPLVKRDEPAGPFDFKAPAELTEQSDPGFLETGAAALRQDNLIGSSITYAAELWNRSPELDLDFDGFEAVAGTEYEQYEQLWTARNRVEFEGLKNLVDQERADRGTLARSGYLGTALSMGASIVDPTILVPGGAAVKGARAGQVALKSAASVGTAAGAGTAIQEAGLQATQVTRSGEESAMAIGGSIVLGTVLGGGIGALVSKGQQRSLTKKLDTYSKDFDDASAVMFPDANSSVGAARVQRGSSELRNSLGADKAFGWQDPLIRLQTSGSAAARQTVRDLAETPLELAENADFIPTSLGGSVETRVKLWGAPLAQSLTDLDQAYAKYRFGSAETRLAGTRDTLSRLGGRSVPKMSYKEFKEAVGQAMIRGDVHDVPEVSEAAQSFRRQLFDPLKDRAIAARLLPEDVKSSTSVSYLTRLYNREQIIARRPEFVDLLRSEFKSQQAVLEANPKATGTLGRLSDAEIRDIAEEVTDTILGTAEGRIPYDLFAGPRGPLKARTLNVRDEILEPWLERDIEAVGRAYVRTMAPDVELSAKFGSVDLVGEVAKVNDDFNAKISASKTEKQRVRFEKQRRAAIRDITGIRDRIRGNFAIPENPEGLLVRSSRVVRNLNYVTLLGSQTLSAIPDLAGVVFHGLVGVVGTDGFKQLVRGSKAFGKTNRQEVRMAGAALDMVLSSRAMAIADISDQYGRLSKFERGVTAVSGRFGVVSLMNQWNAGVKQVTGLMALEKFIRASKAAAAGKATQKQVRALAASGIDENLADRIAKQVERFGEVDAAFTMPRTDQWDDVHARDALRAALVREVDRVIITPGQDKPLWFSKEWGKVIAQFKSFGVSAVQRLVISGMQQRDASTLVGLLSMIALGGVSNNLRELIKGKELDLSPQKQVLEAVDRSGVTGWLFDAHNSAEKVTGLGLGTLAGSKSNRYASRNTAGALLGPSADRIQSLLQFGYRFRDGELSRSDIHAIRKQLPFQNLFYIRQLLDEIEGSTASNL